METKLIFQQVSAVMKAVEAIAKDRLNTSQNYSFRGIDDMYNVLNSHLSDAEIFFTSEVLSVEREERTTKSGGNLIYTVMRIRWTVYAKDGSSITTETIGEAMDSADKSANKAMSAAYKYAMMQLFCIPTKDEKDTEAQSHEVEPKAKPSAPTVEKICVICEKPFMPDARYPFSKTCSYPCVLESRARLSTAVAKTETSIAEMAKNIASG